MKTYREALDEMENNAGYVNPYLPQAVTYQRREDHAQLFSDIQRQIKKLFYPHFISYPEDAETIEALIRLTMSKRILEVGCFTGFSTLHMIRAVFPDGIVVAIDNQKVYPSFFEREDIAKCFRFMHGDTLEQLAKLPRNEPFDFVYVDSDHSLEHTEAERRLLWEVTRKGSIFVFHDCPPKHRPSDLPESGQLYNYLQGLVRQGLFKGAVFPSADRLDMQEMLGSEYTREVLPHLGIFIRQ